MSGVLVSGGVGGVRGVGVVFSLPLVRRWLCALRIRRVDDAWSRCGNVLRGILAAIPEKSPDEFQKGLSPSLHYHP